MKSDSAKLAKERELEKVNTFYLQKEAEVNRVAFRRFHLLTLSRA